jgi:hypothetical protein
VETFPPSAHTVVVQIQSPALAPDICFPYHVNDLKPCSAALGNANRTLKCRVDVSGGIHIDKMLLKVDENSHCRLSRFR